MGEHRESDAQSRLGLPGRELTEHFFAITARMRQYAAGRAGEFGLSFIQARTLATLVEPQPMRLLADRLGLDPSNLTAVIDRLEALGLLTREAMPDDRRIRVLRLTEAGRDLRSQLLAAFGANPVFDNLSVEELASLRDLLDKVLELTGDAVP